MFAIMPMDADWFEQLTAGPYFSTVNFWTPTPWNVDRLKPGDHVYWLYKAPIRKVAGFGQFVRSESKTVREAWEEFGLANGVASPEDLVRRTRRYVGKRTQRPTDNPNPIIGCIVLGDPQYLPREQFVAPEKVGLSFPNQIVTRKYFDEADPFLHVFAMRNSKTLSFQLVSEDAASSYHMTPQKERLGQPQFRSEVLKAYSEKCCIFGMVPTEALEAAHIQPYVNADSNHVQNGLSLRIDLHRLFDAGLIAVDDTFKVLVSSKLEQTEYALLNGRSIFLPADFTKRPSLEALAYHREKRFRP